MNDRQQSEHDKARAKYRLQLLHCWEQAEGPINRLRNMLAKIAPRFTPGFDKYDECDVAAAGAHDVDNIILRIDDLLNSLDADTSEPAVDDGFDVGWPEGNK